MARRAFSFPNGLMDLRQLLPWVKPSVNPRFQRAGDCILDAISRQRPSREKNKCIKHYPCIIQLYFKSSFLHGIPMAQPLIFEAPPADEVSHGQLHQTSDWGMTVVSVQCNVTGHLSKIQRRGWIKMCIYIYMYIYICMHVCMYVGMSVCLSVRPSVCMYIHTYIHACMHACMHTYIHTCMHACMHACIHTYIHTCVYIYIYTHTYVSFENHHFVYQFWVYAPCSEP